MSRSTTDQLDALLESDAERRCKRALFVLENEWGKGHIDVGLMKAILRGDNERS